METAWFYANAGSNFRRAPDEGCHQLDAGGYSFVFSRRNLRHRRSPCHVAEAIEIFRASSWSLIGFSFQHSGAHVEIVRALQRVFQATAALPASYLAKAGGIHHPAIHPDVSGAVSSQTGSGCPEFREGIHDQGETFDDDLRDGNGDAVSICGQSCGFDELEVGDCMVGGDVKRT